jgi:hypothetical protein
MTCGLDGVGEPDGALAPGRQALNRIIIRMRIKFRFIDRF